MSAMGGRRTLAVQRHGSLQLMMKGPPSTDLPPHQKPEVRLANDRPELTNCAEAFADLLAQLG